MEAVQHDSRSAVLTGISNDIVRVLEEFYGKGPGRARTTYDGDLVVILMSGGFTRFEQTLLDAGRGESVTVARAVYEPGAQAGDDAPE